MRAPSPFIYAAPRRVSGPDSTPAIWPRLRVTASGHSVGRATALFPACPSTPPLVVLMRTHRQQSAAQRPRGAFSFGCSQKPATHRRACSARSDRTRCARHRPASAIRSCLRCAWRTTRTGRAVLERSSGTGSCARSLLGRRAKQIGAQIVSRDFALSCGFQLQHAISGNAVAVPLLNSRNFYAEAFGQLAATADLFLNALKRDTLFGGWLAFRSHERHFTSFSGVCEFFLCG